jgi:hypothetical protein
MKRRNWGSGEDPLQAIIDGKLVVAAE